MNLTSRHLRTLRRIRDGKSIFDFDALSQLEEKGAITCEAESSDDIDIKITERGAEYLAWVEKGRPK